MKITLTICIWITIVFCSYAQEKPDVQIHRSQDTTRHSSGWYYGKSTEGQFSILMPLPFADYTVKAKDPNGVLKMCVIKTVSDEGIKFAATEMNQLKKMEDSALYDILEGFRKDPQSKVSDESKEPYQGFPAITLRWEGKNSAMFGRWVKTEDKLFSVMLEFPLEQEKLAEELSETFLNSLNIEID